MFWRDADGASGCGPVRSHVGRLIDRYVAGWLAQMLR